MADAILVLLYKYFEQVYISATVEWVLDVSRFALYNKFVIKTFKDELTQNIYQRQPSRKLPPDIQQVALRKLRMINNAISLNDMKSHLQIDWKNLEAIEKVNGASVSMINGASVLSGKKRRL